MGRVRYYHTNGKRYYVIGVSGYLIVPESARTGGLTKSQTTYSVLDRDWNHEEMARFEPHSRRSSEECQQLAREFARQLNQQEHLHVRVYVDTSVRTGIGASSVDTPTG